MAEDKINKGAIGNEDGINGIPGKYIDQLNSEQLTTVLIGNNDAEKEKRGAGKFGELLGTNIKNASIHIALIICIVLLTFCGIDLIHSFFSEKTLNSEMWNLIFPVVTLALGYIFGKGENK